MSYLTIQRQTILETVKNLRTHPTAKQVFEKAKEKLPDLNFATVYRNLNHLVDTNELKEINFSDEGTRYDSLLRDHQHFICTHCKTIYDLELSKLLNVEQEVKKIPCHEVEFYNLELYGTCHKCKTVNNPKPSLVTLAVK